MRAFFRSRGFKVLSGIISALLVISVIFAAIGKYMSPQSSILSAITIPIQRLAGAVSSSLSNLFTAYSRIDALEEENNQLRQQLREQTEKLIDFDTYKNENVFLHEFLELKEKNPDYSFVPAMISSKDSLSNYCSFTIDVGTIDGVSAHDPVITADGLVGYIGEVGLASSKVLTILDPSVSVGATDSRTKDTGVINGTAEFAVNGTCKMSYLSRTSAVTIGDYIVTSGTGGIFPDDLYIGTVTKIAQETSDISVYATIKPVVDFTEINDVMVITDFDGQGNILE